MDHPIWIHDATALRLGPGPSRTGVSDARGLVPDDHCRVVDPREVTALKAKMNHVTEENRKLTQMLVAVQEDCMAMQAQLIDVAGASSRSREKSSSPSGRKREMIIKDGVEKRRRGDDSCWHHAGHEERKVKITKSYVKVDPVDSSSLVVRDGYQWRKYGQKTTRDNPSPRSYFKCSLAPSCPVKKKVQRSAEDDSMLVVIYEGEHNHPVDLSPRELRSHHHGASSESFTAASDCRCDFDPRRSTSLAEEVALCLSKDADFGLALANTIFERILDFSSIDH